MRVDGIETQIPVGPLGQVAKQSRRRQIVTKVLDCVLRGHARGIKNAGHGAGAGARHHVEGQPRRFERLQHTEMGHALGATTGKGDSNRNATQRSDQAIETLSLQSRQVTAGRLHRYFEFRLCEFPATVEWATGVSSSSSQTMRNFCVRSTCMAGERRRS